MASLYRLASIALVAVTLAACSGEADVDTSDGADGDTTGAASGSGAGDAASPGASTPRAADSPAVGGAQPTMERPVVTTDEQNRIDAWLEAYSDSLNDYGDPQGTMYAGGTPLFNEQQGKPVSKYEYIVAKNPSKPWNQPLPTNRPKRAPDAKKDTGDADSE